MKEKDISTQPKEATTMVTRTVRRGTKLFNKAIDGAKKVMAYDLDNEFRGSECTVKENGWNMRKELELASKRAMLSTTNGVYFVLRVHSNLWFSWGI